MNSSELQLVETTIQGLMNPNNELRKVSECQLEQLMNNKPLLLLTLSQLLNVNQDQAILIYGAVILRKLLEVKTSETVNPVWEAIPPESKSQIKANVLSSLVNCVNKAVIKKIADIVVSLSENIFKSNDKWDEILKYIINGFMIELNPVNQLIIETSVYLLGKVFSYAQSQLVEGIDVFIKGFHLFFKGGSLDIKTYSVQTICEILNNPNNKKDSKKFKEFTFNILETTLTCLDSKDSVNLRICLLALGALSHSVSVMLKKSFPDLFILMGKIIDNKEITDYSLNSIAYEVLLSVIEKYPALINQDKDKLVLLINSIFKFGMKFENTIDDDWLTPKSLSLTHEDFIPEETLDEALSLIDRLILSVRAEFALPILSNIIMELLQHSSEDWKYKYIAYIAVGKISEFVDDVKLLEKFIDVIINDMNNENPKIRYSCLFCIYQFASTFKEDFTNLYNETVLPKMTALLKVDSVLRVKLQICDSMKAFLDKCEKNITDQYIESILDAIFVQFIKSDAECPASLREIILDTLEVLISNTTESFPKYAEKCFGILVEYLKVLIKSTDSSLLNLVGLLIDILTNVGEHCNELLKSSSYAIADTLIHFQNQINNFKGQIGDKFVKAWERLIPFIKESNQEIIPSIFNSIIKVISQPPEMSISSNPNEKINIQQFLADANTQKTKETLLEKKEIITINTSETEEYTIFLQLFCLFLESFKELSFQYVEGAEKEVKRISSYPNTDIRSEAFKIYPLLLQIIKCKCTKEQVGEFFKRYLSILIELAEKEQESKVNRCILDSISDLIDGNNDILTKDDLNLIFSRLFGIFDLIESSRLTLVNEEFETEKELMKGNKKPKNEEEDDDDDDGSENEVLENLDNIQEVMNELEEVLISFSEVIGNLFKTHKVLSLEMATKLLTNVLPKYLDKKASTFEIKMGLYILDDIVEHFGQEPLHLVWTDIGQKLLSYVNSPICEIRQAASYGLGEFIKQTSKDYQKYANEILDGIQNGLKISRGHDPESDFGQAQDNIVTALGKIIKYQNSHYQMSQILPLWVNNLPIVHDSSESSGMHGLLCDILRTQPTEILGNNNENAPHIIRILCKVINSKKYSNDEVDTKIKEIFKHFLENPGMQSSIELAKKNCPNKVLVKIKKYFP